ncbi:dioxygenase family protein [Algoriphagus yeomjeoni]|uniref:Protocatechuate 3,4-dioxygenase beta subunit n=1 Tax=Algoriphagus yeomjeoni TaxID=291403 RepID=A0A327PZL1_9BACT|nr:catechol 1,2-dioxygenase [Algoriphagus yeomjeoni]RAI95126.1 protocatechuate 3,4-dioxygenase beta subunit [Algoriphagus yeomjeoni]
MKRRRFISSAALSVTAMSTFGFIHFDGEKYVGDCATTSDILGPFYRPESPMRSNLRIAGDKGKKIELAGKVLHQDCITPYNNAKVELWHCDAEGVYDNSTPEFRYRGTVMTDKDGNYGFQTILPVPYDAGGGLIRPAHFHLMVTADGYQSLVTQLYFKGDENVANDPWAARSADRVLPIKELADGTSQVAYTIGMAATLKVESASLDRLTGEYSLENDPKKTIAFFKNNNGLWLKNEVFGEEYVYSGNNIFTYPANPDGTFEKFQFDFVASGSVKLIHSFDYGNMGKGEEVYYKK